jgi:hypothetical protein
MALNIQLAFRIAIVWVAGILLAARVRALLPCAKGLLSPPPDHSFVPYDRIGLWTCMMAALTVTGLVVIRASVLDISSNSIR